MKKRKCVMNAVVASFVLLSLAGCDLMFQPGMKRAYKSQAVKTAVSKAIDEEMEFVKPNLDPELQASIDEGSVKGGGPLTGMEIVELTIEEESDGYLDFCYSVGSSVSTYDVDSVMDSARSLIPEDEYQKLEENAEEIEKRLNDFAETYVKSLPEEQQYEFYQDLKTLVTRTVVLMTAGVVYACIPKVVLWGKVSAAAAISVGAGLVAIAVMSIYEDFRFSDQQAQAEEEVKTFEEWIDELIAIPKADFALTSSVTAIAGAMSSSPVAKGICICVFGVANAYDMIKAMLKKYNFNA